MTERWLLVTDLDGTLLNHHDYGFQAVLPMLEQLQQQGIPVILNTSKTFAELAELSQQLNNCHPFIVENGSAIFIPEGYFPPEFVKRNLGKARWQLGYLILTLGQEIQQLNAFIQRQNPKAINFSECSLQTAMQLTGLDPQAARLAQTRLFSVPLVFDDAEKEQQFTEQAQEAGFSCLKGGRFLHLLGPCNKGDSMRILQRLYEGYHRQSFGIIALGDGQNDVAMLEQADIPVVVNSPSSRSLSIKNSATFHTTQEAPEGWVEGVEMALDRIQLIKKQEKNHGR